MAERKIKFIYNGEEIIIQCKKEETTKEILERYLTKIQKTPEDVYFLFNGAILDFNSKLNSEEDSSNEKVVLVCNHGTKIDDNTQEKNFSYSKDIICPTCGESSIITFSDYKINISSCDNGHKAKYILFENFKETQKINEDEIKCSKCKTKRIDTFEQKFYYCNDCKINLCPLCEVNHNKSHKIIEFETKKYYCNQHGEKMISYCKQCKKNLCDLCGLNHDKKHNLIYHREIFENSKIDNLNELRTKIGELKGEIKNIIDKFNTFLNNLEIYYEINNNMVNNFNINNKNFQILSNMKYLNDYNKEIIKEINNIKSQIINEKKFSIIDKIYSKMSKICEITLKYKIETDEDIQIFGEEFVENNKNNFKMVIDNNIYELNYQLEKDKIKNEIIEVKLIQYNKTDNLSCIFKVNDYSDDFISLISISDNFENIDMSDIINMSSMFSSCTSLKSLPDISKWNTNNVNDMSNMFSCCSSLISLPDISKWNTNNVNDMSGMFNSCTSLKSLPDISKWNTNNVNDMSFMFSSCTSLISFPDISKWNTNNVKNMSLMFSDCESLESFPDISKWNTNNVNYMDSMFTKCKSLISLPDISKWNTNKVKIMSYMFSECETLMPFPDISKWDFSNVISLENIFLKCPDNIYLPIMPDIKLNLCEGYIYENQFSQFLVIFKKLLLKKEKTENKFEIKGFINDINSSNCQISSIRSLNPEETFKISKNNINKLKWLFTIQLEIKDENKENFNQYAIKINELIKDLNQNFNGYYLKFRILNKNLYFDLLSKKNELYKRILDCFLDTTEFDINIKSGFDANFLLNESLNDEIIDKIFSFLTILKTSNNIHYIINSLYSAIKYVKFNNNNIQEFHDLFSECVKGDNYLEIFEFFLRKIIKEGKESEGDKFKEAFKEEFGFEFEEEFEGEFGEKFKEKFNNVYKQYLVEKLNNIFENIRNFIKNEFKKILDCYGLIELFLLLDLDSIKLSFYSPENKSGVELNLQIKNINKVLAEFIK